MSQPTESNAALAIICSLDLPGATPGEPLWFVTGQLGELLTEEDKADIIQHAQAVLKRRLDAEIAKQQ